MMCTLWPSCGEHAVPLAEVGSRERSAASWGAGFVRAGARSPRVEVSVGRWREAWRSGGGERGVCPSHGSSLGGYCKRNLGSGSSWVLRALGLKDGVFSAAKSSPAAG